MLLIVNALFKLIIKFITLMAFETYELEWVALQTVISALFSDKNKENK